MRRRIVVMAAAAALVAAAPPASSRPAERLARSRAVAIPGVPRLIEPLVAQQRRTGSNFMFAHLVTEPHKGYTWSVFAYKESPSAKTILRMHFWRNAAQDTQRQTSDFSWTLPKGALRMDRDLKPASLVTGQSMGTNGAISMRLASAGRLARARPESCASGSMSIRLARFTGSFRVHLRDEYFKRISFRRARVALYRERDLRCSGPEPPPPPCPRDLSFNAFDAETGVAVGAFKTPEGRVDQTVVVARPSGDADAVHMISVTLAVPEAFDASDDLTSAHVDGDAGAPWLSGDLSYVAPPPSDGEDERCGAYRESAGIATGDYTVFFDAVGPVSLASTGVPATLRRES